jgi:hypothetical protein
MSYPCEARSGTHNGKSSNASNPCGRTDNGNLHAEASGARITEPQRLTNDTQENEQNTMSMDEGKCTRCRIGCKIRGGYCLPCYEKIKSKVNSDKESTVEVRALSGQLVLPSGIRACKGCWQVDNALGMVQWIYPIEDGKNRSAPTPTRFFVGTLELGPSEPLGMFGRQVTCGFTTESNATEPYFDVPAADVSNVSTPRTPSMNGQDST